ncbi:MAG: cysteine methyltransferase, partial [Pseudomonadota bacterium]
MDRKRSIHQKAARVLAENDPVFGRAMERIGPCRLEDELKPAITTFEALLEAITHQQLSTKAAATIYGRVRALAPAPTPEYFSNVSEQALRSAGLSGPKIRAVHDLTERCCSGRVPTMTMLEGMNNELIIESLSQIRGIGRWSAEMLLIFRLGRLDVLPLQDLGIQQGFNASFRRSKT